MQKASAPTSNRRRLALLIAAPLLAVMAFLSWGLSSPAGSSPDDDFHLSSIWCGHGDNPNGCEAVENPEERSVSRDLVIDSVCFAFNEEASAACQGEDFGENPDDVVTTPRGNFAGQYPPVYYFTMSLFAGDNIETSVLIMKSFNSIFFVGIVALLFWMLPIHRRTTLVWALALSLVPLGMFIVPSTNPSGWAILSAGTLWLAALGHLESTGWRRWGLAALAVVSTLIGAGSRGDSALFSGFALLLVVLLTARKQRSYWLQALLPFALMVVSGLLYLSASQSEAVSTGLDPQGAGESRVDSLTLAIANLINVPSLWSGALGAGPLGWLDTIMPGAVGVAVLVCVGGAVFLGLGMRVRRKGVALIAATAVLFLFPTVLLVQSQALVGAYMQPRYLLPLIVLTLGIVLLHNRGEFVSLSRVQVGAVVVALSLANAVALHTNIRRYVRGADGGGVNLDSGGEWWWDIPLSPMATWIVGSLAFAGLLTLLANRLLYSERPMVVEPVDASAR